MKNYFYLLTLLVTVNSFSQEIDKFRVGLDLGWTLPTAGGGGILFAIEPKYNIKENLNIGLRMSSAAMVKDVQFKDSNENADGKLAANNTYLATLDYYFYKGKNFVPYIGFGAGYTKLANIRFDLASDVELENEEIKLNGKFAGLIRGGFEWGKFRFGADLNLIPKSNLKDGLIDENAEISNSYFSFNLGFFIGGGKWGK
jgi:opacity protein-like surface antigen